MSFDYFVIVHAENWPSFKKVQESLGAIKAPLELQKTSDEPFAVTNDDSAISVIFEGRSVVIEATIERATDLDDRDSVFGDIANLIELNFTVAEGDYVLTLTFGAEVDPIRAGLYLAAAMILGFHGYGFENQFESYGGPGFAKRLLAEADAAIWTD